MLKSTKVGLVSVAIWAAINAIKAVYAPAIDPFDESSVVVMSGPFYTLLSLSQFLANMLVFVALVAFAVALMTKLKLLPRGEFDD